MKKGQMFSLDLVIALILIVATIAALVQLRTGFFDASSESVRSMKLNQMADDAAALKYYNKSLKVLNNSAKKEGYVVFEKKSATADYSTCFSSIRGTQNNSVKVFVCEKD